MSAFYGDRDDDESTKTIHRALELGVTLLDTAEMYGPHLNEELIGAAVGGRDRDSFVLATKFGIVRDLKADPPRSATTAHQRTFADRSRDRCSG